MLMYIMRKKWTLYRTQLLTCSSSELLASKLTLFSDEVGHLCNGIPACDAAKPIRPVSVPAPPLVQINLIRADAKNNV